MEDELIKNKLLIKKENYVHNVGRSERTNSVIEPKVSKQWFLKMDEISKPAIMNVLDKRKHKVLS